MNPAIKDAFEREFPVPQGVVWYEDYSEKLQQCYGAAMDIAKNGPDNRKKADLHNAKLEGFAAAWDAGAGERRNSERYVFLRDATDDVVDEFGLVLIANSAVYGSGGLQGAQWDEEIDKAIAAISGQTALAAAKEAT